MNKLKLEKQTAVVSASIENCSIRSVERMTGVYRDTITRIMVRVGDISARFMDQEMRGLGCKHLQAR